MTPKPYEQDRLARRKRGGQVLAALPADVRQYVLRCVDPALDWHWDIGTMAEATEAAAEVVGRWLDALDGPAFWRVISQGEGVGA